jgi:hypothetical protein
LGPDARFSAVEGLVLRQRVSGMTSFPRRMRGGLEALPPPRRRRPVCGGPGSLRQAASAAEVLIGAIPRTARSAEPCARPGLFSFPPSGRVCVHELTRL